MTQPSRPTDGVAGVLDAIEHAVSTARTMPISSSVIVNRSELLTLVAQVRAALPAQLQAADALVADADAARAASREQADRILADARSQAERMVATDQLVLDAQDRAARVLADAEQDAARMRREADDYCDRRLADFEIDLGKVLAQVQAGRAKLAGRLGTGR